MQDTEQVTLQGTLMHDKKQLTRHGAGRTARNTHARQETPCTTRNGSHRKECPRTTGNSLQDMEQVTHTCSFPIPRARARVCEARQLVVIVPCGVPSPSYPLFCLWGDGLQSTAKIPKNQGSVLGINLLQRAGVGVCLNIPKNRDKGRGLL